MIFKGAPKIPAYINGLPLDGVLRAKLVVHDGDTWPGQNAVKLWEGYSDEYGNASFKLPRNLKKRNIHLWVMHDQFEHLSERVNVTDLGLFHTVHLKECILKAANEPLAIHPDKTFSQLQREMQTIYRNSKHKNYISKGFWAITTVGACFIGWYFAGVGGLILGCLLSIVSILLGSYASGDVKGI